MDVSRTADVAFSRLDFGGFRDKLVNQQQGEETASRSKTRSEFLPGIKKKRGVKMKVG